MQTAARGPDVTRLRAAPREDVGCQARDDPGPITDARVQQYVGSDAPSPVQADGAYPLKERRRLTGLRVDLGGEETVEELCAGLPRLQMG